MVIKTLRTMLAELSQQHGFDVENDENFHRTPERVSAMYNELLAGYQMDAGTILQASFPSDDYDQMIVCKDIDFFSLCSHHMLPFFGKAAVGYIPGCGSVVKTPGKVVGLSKLARIVQMFARRFQIQERMTMQIANALQKHLQPQGVGVVIYDSIHLCMTMRGVKQHKSSMDTSCMLGDFRSDPAVRQEFFSMISR